MAKILNIRGVDEEVSRQFAAGAAVRGITQAEYLGRLIELRERVAEAIQLTEQTIRGPGGSEEPPLSAAEALEFIQSFVVRYSLKDRIA